MTRQMRSEAEECHRVSAGSGQVACACAARIVASRCAAMSEHPTAPGKRPTAVVVAVQLPDVGDGELASSIAELERLARTLGLDPIGRITQRRGRLASGIVVGEGKLKELAAWTGGTGVVPAYARPGRRKARDEDDDEADDEVADEADDDAGADGARTDRVDDGERHGTA